MTTMKTSAEAPPATPAPPLHKVRSVDVRDHLVRALAADLIGPFDVDCAAPSPTENGDATAPRTEHDELLPIAPSRWYLCGFLAPQEQRQLEEDEPTDDDALANQGEARPDEPDAEAAPRAQKRQWPASIGMTLLLPKRTRALDVTVRWADYVQEEPLSVESGHLDSQGTPISQAASWSTQPKPAKRARRPTGRAGWRRVVPPPVRISVDLDPERLRAGIDVPGSRGLRLRGELRPTGAAGIPDAQALSLFLVNERAPVTTRGRCDEAFAFGVELEVSCPDGMVPRPDLAGGQAAGDQATDWDDRVAALQYRDHREYAVGHGVSVEVLADLANGATGQPTDPRDASPTAHPSTTGAPRAAAAPTRARTTWLPRASVLRVEPFRHPDIEVRMDELAALDGAAAVNRALGHLPQAYGAWLREQAAIPLDGESRRSLRETRDELLAMAEKTRVRLADGIALLARDPEVRRAFCLANGAMADQARKRPRPDAAGVEEVPTWRLFQLAFVLLNLPSISDPAHPERDTVELIFFPTGGGKTEAYLGVIACVLLLRRIRRRKLPDQGLGVAVVLRYTLRLLTLDQLGRAATLMCALELLRRKDTALLGEERFSLGLWVGRSATANTFIEVKKQLETYRHDPSERALSPFPLAGCPWCREEFSRTSFDVEQTKGLPAQVVVRCPRFDCEFKTGVPVLFVDEEIYRELPGFVIATVDKFAMLPWRGETAALFGKVTHRQDHVFYGAVDGKVPKGALKLPEGLLPPELIVQDELHLISGPLGTMVGLYETAVDLLCTRADTSAGAATGRSARPLRPKILASTATVKRARDQILALYARRSRVFPPPEVNAAETFFARVDREAPGRLYLGVAAPGRAIKAILIRTYTALLTAAHACYDREGPARQPADPYLTLVGYFNSLRELGGMRRLVESEVHQACLKPRSLQSGAGVPWFASAELGTPVELTSRESTFAVAQAKHALARFASDPQHVDVVLASNMISVGVDIDRLGLMVVAGQPKSTSEYIQATSRVGRDRDRPGLVVAVLNAHKPRDRSYYEHFAAYHESFYRRVEATSVTPFAGPALDRGMAGALVAMTRLSDPDLNPPTGFMELLDRREVAEAAVQHLAERARQVTGKDELAAVLLDRGRHFLDAWQRVIDSATEAAGARTYSRFDPGAAKLGRPVLAVAGARRDPSESIDEGRFRCPTSMRDVESSVHLWLTR